MSKAQRHVDLKRAQRDAENPVVDLGDAQDPTPFPNPALQHWNDRVKAGAPVFMLSVERSAYYKDCETRDPQHQTLQTLLDEARVLELAPNVQILPPHTISPWPVLVETPSFSLWLDRFEELDALWRHLPQWLKTDWHDRSSAPYAKDVWSLRVLHHFDPMLEDKLQDFKDAQQHYSDQRFEGFWDGVAQRELKTMLSSAVLLEDHPTMGASIHRLMQEMIPLLDHSIEGKARLKASWKAFQATENALYASVSQHVVRLADWTPNLTF